MVESQCVCGEGPVLTNKSPVVKVRAAVWAAASQERRRRQQQQQPSTRTVCSLSINNEFCVGRHHSPGGQAREGGKRHAGRGDQQRWRR